MAVLVVSGVLLVVSQGRHIEVAAIQSWLANMGIMGPLLFIGLYAFATVFFFPGSVLTITGGVLFGPLWGTLFNLTGATLGATLAFVIARYVASDWAEQKSAGKLKQLKHGIESEGWRFIAFVRLVPLFPFNLLNYALGLTRIPLSHYALASFVFMFPGGVAYTYLGYVGSEAAAGSENLIQKSLAALALLATVAFIPRLVKRFRQGNNTEKMQ